MAGPKRRKLTCSDLAALPDDGKRHELIDGVLHVLLAPTSAHQTVSRLLQFELMAALELTGIAQVFNAPWDVILSEHDMVEPDLAIVRESRRHLIAPRGLEGPPDLVVEILSPSTRARDEGKKRRLYGDAGVPEYWLVDPELCFVEVFRLKEGELRPVDRFERDATLISREFPELAIELERVFRRP